MNPQERLTLLGTRVSKYDIGQDELLRELGKLQDAFDGGEREANYREKVGAAAAIHALADRFDARLRAALR
jgi:hypothetical protein